ncbi:MAG TPA: FMN-binding protein [Solirubrobacteraceae bacterium]|nr:FMN-binding protein [Solirubrobacteraceae bacterium]
MLVPLAVLAGCGGHARPKPSTTPAEIGGAKVPPAPARKAASGTFTGADVPTRFGDVQVQVVMRAGRITDVGAVRLPFDRPRSQFISQQAAPILRSEVLAAQSARIDLLTGATFTSDAWATSVQSALNRAR